MNTGNLNTPLHNAVSRGHQKVVELLLAVCNAPHTASPPVSDHVLGESSNPAEDEDLHSLYEIYRATGVARQQHQQRQQQPTVTATAASTAAHNTNTTATTQHNCSLIFFPDD